MTDRSVRLLLLASVFVIATCGLIYELIAGTLASYLLGDSVTQFSTVIGAYLFAMGVGSWLSRFVERRLLGVFIQVEFYVGLVGGASAALLFGLFGQVGSFRVLLYALVFLVGAMVGLEIPLLLRILRDRLEFKDLVAKVLALDYVGALLASLLFPLVLVPRLGLVRSAFFFGMLNVLVGLITLRLLRERIAWARGHAMVGGGILVVLGVGFALSDRLVTWAEGATYSDVIYARSSAYQRIVLTRGQGDLRLYLNGNLQFAQRDEYRYHEALVHPGMAAAPRRARVLVLGGGDGLAVREILRWPDVERVTLVDLDPAMTQLFSSHELLTALNDRALLSPKVQVVNADAFLWVQAQPEAAWDFILADFPDPSNFALGKLYSTAFYSEVRRALAPDGVLCVQCTSPYAARRAFWTTVHTLDATGFGTRPYHAYVPSFGEWGFVLASPRALLPPSAEGLPPGLRFLDAPTLATMFRFPRDMGEVPTEVNRLNNQVLVRVFEEEWKEHAH